LKFKKLFVADGRRPTHGHLWPLY